MLSDKFNLKLNPLIVITGPTASGKTSASLELSKLLDIEIISADSRQIYRYLDIGTAKPSKDELSIVKHHFIDILNPDEYYSAGLFGKHARSIAIRILNEDKIPVVVGGSGLYIKALCEGLFDEINENSKKELSEDIQKLLRNLSRTALYNELKKVDIISYNKYKDMNPRRLIRALEFFYIYGYPISEAQENQSIEPFFNIYYFGIYIERNQLYRIIDRRCEKMWSDGLVQETKDILSMGYSPLLNSLNTVGYKESIAFLKGSINQSQALELLKKNTRNYAKRQTTWFKKNEKIKWLEGSSTEIAKNICMM